VVLPMRAETPKVWLANGTSTRVVVGGRRGNVVPPAFPGLLLWPDPPVRRELSVYTRVRPDPITAAFVTAISRGTLATPPHILDRLGSPR
jgi:hypothetical protein